MVDRGFVPAFYHRLCPLFALVLLTPAQASADVAPGLSLASLHQETSDALARLAALRPLPAGTYVTFDADPVHPYVVPACDDDGDAVIAVSDAALKLLEHASYALAQDQLHGTRTREGYAAQLAASQKPSARLLPPGEWFFRGVDAAVETLATAHFRAALTFWVGRAASVHDAQEFRCTAPNALREVGDRTWTEAERSVALARAAKLDPERDDKRTIWALAGLLALGGHEASAVTVAELAASHPWRGPLPLPTASVVQTTATTLRANAPQAPPPPAATAAKRAGEMRRLQNRFAR